MKITILLAALLLTACASGPSREQIALNQYIQQSLPLAGAGKMKWSTYFAEVYERGERAGMAGVMLDAVNLSSGYALEYEAGTITKEEFDYKTRAARTKAETYLQSVADQDAQRRQALGAAQLAAGLAMMNASQPQYAAPSPQSYTPPRPSGNAYVTGYIRSNTVNGSLRYCNYSNGAVITVAASSVCATSTR